MAFCKLCDRDVGEKIKRPIVRVILCIAASIGSFVFMVMLTINYQEKARVFATIGTTPTSGPISDTWLVVPLLFLIIAGYLFFKGKKIHCGICSNEIDKT